MQRGLCFALACLLAGVLQLHAAEAGPSPSSSTAGGTFEVRGYQVDGNTLLPPARLAFLTNYTGAAVALPRVQQAMVELQLRYRNLGYATVAVTLPRQTLSQGVVHLRVVEGRLARVAVEGNQYFSSNNVRRSLPSLETNVLLNTKWFQPELDRANANADRQIYPVIHPGANPETSDLVLKVTDRLPFHGHIEINDKSTPNTPLLRVDSALQYNNLWQLDHQVGVQYAFSPQAYKSGDYLPNLFDQPMVASYSGFYRLPLGAPVPLRENWESLPADFGYDEATHRFRAPAAGGGAELIVYGSRSASDTPPRFGPLTVLTNTTLADISSQSEQRNLTFNDDVGAKLTMPLPEMGGFHSSFSAGFDFKTYELRGFNTNLTYFDLYALDQYGNRVLVTNQTVALPANSDRTVVYLPLTFAWFGSRADRGGVTSFNLGASLFTAGLASARTNFQILAGSTQAGGNYATLTAGAGRDQKLPGNWSLRLRANGQWASAPLINNEEFALGGTTGVRGYREGEAYGDNGWRCQLDLRAPAVNIGAFPNAAKEIPAFLRGSVFMDYGEVWHLAGGAVPSVREWGAGVGAYLTAGQHFEARLTLAWALHDTPLTRAGEAQAYFGVGFQF